MLFTCGIFLLGGLQYVFMEISHKMNEIGFYKVMFSLNIFIIL